MSDWTPPPETRWWLEGHAGEARLTLVGEHAVDRDAPPCPLPPPERGEHAWLSAYGIGVQLEHNDGAHGWIETMAMRRERPDETAARRARAKEGRRSTQGQLL